MALLGGFSTPNLPLTSNIEVLAQNIAATAVPIGQQGTGAVAVRGNIACTTGTGTTELVVRLRVGQNNTASALVALAEQVGAGASTTYSAPFEFIDTAGIANLAASGYSLTIQQSGGGSNGQIASVDYEVEVVGSTAEEASA